MTGSNLDLATEIKRRSLLNENGQTKEGVNKEAFNEEDKMLV